MATPIGKFRDALLHFMDHDLKQVGFVSESYDWMRIGFSGVLQIYSLAQTSVERKQPLSEEVFSHLEMATDPRLWMSMPDKVALEFEDLPEQKQAEYQKACQRMAKLAKDVLVALKS
jgi:hypothetical protein